MIAKTLQIMCLLLLVLCTIALLLSRDILLKVRQQLQPAFSRKQMENYSPKTGDIFMVHYLGHGMIGLPRAEHWPTHAALVWVMPNGKAAIIENTKFSAPYVENILPETVYKDRGVRVVDYETYVASVDCVIYVREMVNGSISSLKVYEAVHDWAAFIDFETRIADSMTWDVTLAIGFATVWKQASRWGFTAAKLQETERRKNQAFCSEFVCRLLHRLGAIRHDFTDHFLVGPASYLQSGGMLETIAADGFEWGEDRLLVRRL